MEIKFYFLLIEGYAPHAMCVNCIKVFSCPNCSINLVFHKRTNKLHCHYCGYKSLLDRKCTKKKFCELVFSGPGVEKN